MKSAAFNILGMAVLFTGSLSACSSDDSTTGSVADSSTQAITFTGGLFELETFEVSDSCLDGGLNLVFMPEGAETPYLLAENNELPAEDALPSSQTIKLQAPFDSMAVEITSAGNDAMQIRNALQAGVIVDESQWGQCQADMTIDADITVIDNDNVTIATTVNVTTWTDGPTAADECPATDACLVTLSMRGRRVQ